MSETTRFMLNLRREPVAVDDRPESEIRGYVLQRVEQEVGTTGGAAPTLSYVLTGAIERAVIDPAQRGPEFERVIAASFRSVGDRPEVLRRFRTGEVLVTHDGAMRRCAAVLEHLPTAADPDAWWLAYRPFGQGELGVGVLHEGWYAAQGRALDTLEEPFRGWLDAGGAAIEAMQIGPQAASKPIVNVGAGAFPAHAPVPFDATQLCAIVGEAVDPENKLKYPEGVRAFVFAGRTWERWDLAGISGAEIDEVIRFAAAQDGVYGVAVTWPSMLATPTGPCRGWVVVAEAGGARMLRATAMRAGPAGEVVYEGPFYEPPPEKDMVWLGVAPRDGVGLAEALGFFDRHGNRVDVPEA